VGGFGGRKRCISIVDVPKADPSPEGEGHKKQLKQNTKVSKFNVAMYNTKEKGEKKIDREMKIKRRSSNKSTRQPQTNDETTH